jgi:hypothetical protein
LAARDRPAGAVAISISIARAIAVARAVAIATAIATAIPALGERWGGGEGGRNE